MSESSTSLPDAPGSDDFEPRVGRTWEGIARTGGENLFEPPSEEFPDGRFVFGGRRVIGHGSRIEGGVYLGSGSREAIVVDETKTEALTGSYSEVLQRITVGDQVDKRKALQTVYEVTQEKIPYDLDKTDEYVRPYSDDTKVALDNFINKGFGVCRHQALLAGYLLEKLKDDGILRGQVSVNRNFVPGRGAHAWAEYTTFSGTAYVIDPAQSYFGLKSEARQRGAWRYETTEERSQAAQE
jgi:transglutaminase superfamily protein